MTQDDFQRHVIETLARLETNMTGLIGNGQPGRINKLEVAVESLNRWRWLIAGGVLAVSTIVHFIFKY